MEADTQANVAFFLTGQRAEGKLAPVADLGLAPALFAPYRDLAELRHDFPLLFLPAGKAGGTETGPRVRALSGAIDAALATAAVGDHASRIRRRTLRLEQELRKAVLSGRGGKLGALWDEFAKTQSSDVADWAADLARVRAALAAEPALLEAELVACDAALPAKFVRHAWRAVEKRKADAFGRRLQRLVRHLSEILEADFERSREGLSPARLATTLGGGFGAAFDFEALSRTLATAPPPAKMPDSRRRRIGALLDTLRSQRFFPAQKTTTAKAPAPHTFEFATCAEALAAFHGRMAELTSVARALAIAELEIAGLYSEARHDALFEHFGANGLDPAELSAFPDYLVCANAARLDAAEHAELLEALSSGLPIKVLLVIDDVLEESPYGEGNLTSGTRIRQVASMAIGLNEVFVLQTPSSHLARFCRELSRGLESRGPALFSVFSGASGIGSGLSPYVTAAAALESRAFPAFVFDPDAGADWAARFRLDANPSAERDWPVAPFEFEGADHQRVREDLAFTLVDFVAADRRYARHLARVPRERWDAGLVSVDAALARDRKGLPEQVPYVAMVDAENRLHRVIVDERLLREARRTRELWHSLQELGGVHNSHAEALLARERRAWEERARSETPPAAPIVTVAKTETKPAPASAPKSAETAAQPARSSDEAYIETPRCSTCNECITINDKMFAYDGNKQAYIANPAAGTYAQLVEAAESCQVSIIHPGKPHNPAEPGLPALLERAAAFR